MELLNENDNKFKSFTLSLKVESVEEARTLFHLFNYANLTDTIKKNWYRKGLKSVGYSTNIAELTSNSDIDIFEFIRNKIQENGEVL